MISDLYGNKREHEKSEWHRSWLQSKKSMQPLQFQMAQSSGGGGGGLEPDTHPPSPTLTHLDPAPYCEIPLIAETCTQSCTFRHHRLVVRWEGSGRGCGIDGVAPLPGHQDSIQAVVDACEGVLCRCGAGYPPPVPLVTPPPPNVRPVPPRGGGVTPHNGSTKTAAVLPSSIEWSCSQPPPLRNGYNKGGGGSGLVGRILAGWVTSSRPSPFLIAKADCRCMCFVTDGYVVFRLHRS